MKIRNWLGLLMTMVMLVCGVSPVLAQELSGMGVASLNGSYKIAEKESSHFKLDNGPVMGLIAANDIRATFDGAGGCSVSFNRIEFQEQYGAGEPNVTTPYFTQVNSSPQSTGPISCTYTVSQSGALAIDLGPGGVVSGWQVSADGNNLLKVGALTEPSSDGIGTINKTQLLVGMKLGSNLNNGSLNGNYRVIENESILFKSISGPVLGTVAAKEMQVSFDGSGSCNVSYFGNEFQERYSAEQELQIFPYFTQVASSPETVTNADCSYSVAADGALDINLVSGGTIAGWHVSANGSQLLKSGARIENNIDGTMYTAQLHVGTKLGSGMGISMLNGTYRLGEQSNTLFKPDIGPVMSFNAANDITASFDGAGGCTVSYNYNEFQERYTSEQDPMQTPYFTQVTNSSKTVGPFSCTYNVYSNGEMVISAPDGLINGYFLSADGSSLAVKGGAPVVRSATNDGYLNTAQIIVGIKLPATAPASVWTVASYDPFALNGIDWPQSQHGPVSIGNYLKVGGTFYYVNGSGIGMHWEGSDPSYVYAVLQNCDQTTGAPLFVPPMNTIPQLPNMTASVGQTIELYTSFPTVTPPTGWTVYSYNSGNTGYPPNAIDWFASQHAPLNPPFPGTYLKIAGTYYAVIIGGPGSWSGMDFNGAEIANCDQQTGAIGSGPINLAALVNQPIEYFASWATAQLNSWSVSSVSSNPASMIDWPLIQHGPVTAGNYLKVGPTFYKVFASAIGSRFRSYDPNYVDAVLLQVNQATGMTISDPIYPEQLLFADLTGSAGMPIIAFDSWPIYSGPLISLSANVVNNMGQPQQGAQVQVVGNPLVSTTTGTDGSFVLNGLPTDRSFALKISASGFLPIYTADFTSSSNIIIPTCRAFGLLNDADKLASGTDQGSGLILGSLVDEVAPCQSDTVSGAQIFAYDFNDPQTTYKVNFGNNGLFSIVNLPDGVKVRVVASKMGMVFKDAIFQVKGDGVNIGAVLGTVAPSITGWVSSSGGTALANVMVEARNEQNSPIAFTSTDSVGSYRFFNLAPGNYRLFFFTAQNEGYMPLWYVNGSDFNSATPVQVSSLVTTENVNVIMMKGGTISGLVTNTSGQPLSGITVYYGKAESYGPWPSVSTGADGTYSINGLTSGNYLVQFDGQSLGYPSSYYNNSLTLDGAQQIAIAGEAVVSNINAVLNQGAVISGRATDLNNNGISNIYVTLFDEQMNFINSVNTGSNGNYSFNNLQPGSYKVRFQGNGSPYIEQWYNNATDFASALPVTVITSSVNNGIDAKMIVGGAISGKVTDQNNNGLNFIGVWVYNNSGQFVTAVFTAANGNYTVNGLPSGNYRLRATPSSTYASNWYGNSSKLATATPVTLVAPATVSFINIALEKFGAISGRLTDQAGQPIVNSVAVVYNSDGEMISAPFADSNGNYMVPELRPGNYKVNFQAFDYPQRWYNNALNMASATQVTVVADRVTSGIDGMLVRDNQPAIKPASLWVRGSTSTATNPIVWGASTTPGASYEVEEATDALFTQNLRQVYSGNALSSDVTVAASGKYYYRVRALADGYQASVWVNSVASTVTLITAKPASLWVRPASANGEIAIVWGSSTTTGASYVVEESTNAEFTASIQIYSGSALNLTISGKLNGTYYYRVKAVANGFNESAWKTTDHGCLVSRTANPPTSIWVRPASVNGETAVSWVASTTPGATYLVEEATDAEFVSVKQVYGGSNILIKLPGRTNGSYYYRVKAIAADFNESPWKTGKNPCVVTRP